MSEQVKRYDAVHIRYEDNNIHYGEGCEVEVVTAADYEREVRIAIAAGQRMQDKCDALRAEAEVLDTLCQSRFDEIAQLKSEAEALRAERDELREELSGVKNVSTETAKAMKRLVMCARTSGGTAGPDAGLMDACEQAEKMLSLGGIGRAYMEGADATQAPEVQASGPYASVAGALAQRYPKPSLLKDCNVSYSNSSRPLAEQGERQEVWARQCDLDESDPALVVSRERVEESGYTVRLTTATQPSQDVRALLSADDVRDACANAVSVFAEEANADQCREVAEYMREVLLAQIAHRQAQRQ